MAEHWTRWYPSEVSLAPKYHIDTIIHDLDNFRMLLTDKQNEKQQVWVIFEHSIDIFRNTDESYCLKTITMLTEKHGKEFYTEWTFFKVENSEYLRWIFEQSLETFPQEWYTHFAFLEDNSIVDVVSNYEPRFEFVTLP